MRLITTLTTNLNSLPISDITVLLDTSTNAIGKATLTEPDGSGFRLAIAGVSLTIGFLLLVLLWHRSRTTAEKLKAEIRACEAAQSKNEKLSLQLLEAQNPSSFDTLSAGIAHDFNNTLQAISLFAELTKDRVSEEAGVHQYLNSILELAKQGNGIALGLRSLGGRHEIVKSVQSLPTLVQEIAAMVRHMLPTSIEISSEMPSAPDRILVEMNETQMKQVLLNLVLNARDAMPNGGKMLFRLDEVTPDVTHARLSVSDTGVGMSDEVKARVFQPFFTTKDRGQGTGLGMSMAHEIVKDHGGTIKIDTRVGSGTTVRILLPVACGDQSRTETLSPPSMSQTGN